MAKSEMDELCHVYVPKSNVWTIKHRYPRTLHNKDYSDWSSNPVREGMNMYSHPVSNGWHPLPPHKHFRPLPHMERQLCSLRVTKAMQEAAKLRLSMAIPRGCTTPAEAMHFGYRKFSLDPSSKTMRQFNDSIPHPLLTVARESYVSPADRANLVFEQNKTRYGLTLRSVALGIVPLVMSIRPEPIKDTSQSKDYLPVTKNGGTRNHQG